MGHVGRRRLVFSSGNHDRALSLVGDVQIRDNGRRLCVSLEDHFVSVDIQDGKGPTSPTEKLAVALDAAFLLGWLVGDTEAGR